MCDMHASNLTEDEKIFSSLLETLSSTLNGDYASFDGRDGQNWLCELMKVQIGKSSVEEFRDICDLCPAGHDHWTEDCDDCEENSNEVSSNENSEEDNETFLTIVFSHE